MSADAFLPFSRSGKQTELQAIAVKKALGLVPSAAVDPFEVLPRVPATIVSRDVFASRPDIERALFDTHREEWSAIGLGCSAHSGVELILLNLAHHPHRQKVSLMEEIVHVVLGHPRTTLELPAAGERWTRPYQDQVEDEAFCVGAACILPWPEIFDAVSRRAHDAQTIATTFAVSRQYVEYRIRRAGLDRVYKARQRARV